MRHIPFQRFEALFRIFLRPSLLQCPLVSAPRLSVREVHRIPELGVHHLRGVIDGADEAASCLGEVPGRTVTKLAERSRIPESCR